ncbi:MAG TPA: transaldolase [Candidatus Acidoferrum sp.]
MTTTTTLPNAGATGTTPLKALNTYGQSPWMDYIRRDLLLGGGLKKMIDQDGLRGMTSNPTIFEKAITGSKNYSDILESPDSKKLDAKGVYEKIAIRDVQDAADTFKGVYAETKGRDGYVSLEVSPLLANDTQKTIDEARRLWKTVSRENVMIKVPATPEGIPAIRQLLEDGININITLLFAQSAYEQVAEAFLSALEARVKKGQDVSKIASVASFFVSRIDTLIDGQIEAKLKTETDPKKKELLQSIEGQVAIANAKLTYKKYQELFGGARWKALAAKGAQTQRLLWASTSTKNPKYRDVLYVEELIGADTVDTIPPATFDAFRDHGKLRNSLTENVDAAAKTMSDLEKAGISMKGATEKLVVDGVKLFAEAFDKLLDATGKTAGVSA